MTGASIVILGAGQGGFQVATSLRENRLRENGFEGRIVLMGEEPDLPYAYERLPLTKGYLLGQTKTTNHPQAAAHYRASHEWLP